MAPGSCACGGEDIRSGDFANAADPEQNTWYRRMREQLEEDPWWEDGEIHEG